MADLGRFEGFSFSNVEPCERFIGLVEKCSRMTSRRLLTRSHDTVETMSSTLKSVHTPGSDVHRSVVATSVFRNEKRKSWCGHPVRDGVSLLLRQVCKTVERAEAAVTAERSLGKVLDELFSGEWRA